MKKQSRSIIYYVDFKILKIGPLGSIWIGGWGGVQN